MLHQASRLIDRPRAWLTRAEDWMLDEPRALYGSAACRIGTALAVLGLLVANFSSRDIWAGEGSIWAAPVKAFSQFPEIALLDGVSGDVLTVLYVLTMAAAAALTLGWHTKAANLVTLVGFIAIVGQNPVVGDEGDNLLRITLLWMLLMRTSEHWSLDARRRSRSEPDQDSAVRQAWDGDEVLPHWLATGLHHVGLLGLMVQTMVVFTAGGLDKISQDVWKHGTALYYTMQLPEFRPFPALSDAVSSSNLVLAVLTYVVLLTQLFFAPLLLNPVSRRILLFVTIAVNVVLAVLLALPWSSLAFVALTSLFVADETFVRIGDRVAVWGAPVWDWFAFRWYDLTDGFHVVVDRTVYPVVDWFSAVRNRR